jgi:hypothetical protein
MSDQRGWRSRDVVRLGDGTVMVCSDEAEMWVGVNADGATIRAGTQFVERRDPILIAAAAAYEPGPVWVEPITSPALPPYGSPEREAMGGV